LCAVALILPLLLLCYPQKSTYVERCMRFFGAFTAKTPADNEAAAAVVEELLTHLAGHLSALDKAVRYRSAQLLLQLLAGVPASLLLEDSVAQLLRDSLQERLHDKQPAVRAEACRAVSHLVSDDEVGQPARINPASCHIPSVQPVPECFMTAAAADIRKLLLW
jgi:hypothetical protein